MGIRKEDHRCSTQKDIGMGWVLQETPRLAPQASWRVARGP